MAEDPKPETEEFGRNRGFLPELFQFLRESKKWWLAPIVIVLLLLGVLIALGGTSAAPFIYTLF